MSFYPSNEMVAVQWLKGITYLGNRVATELPTDNSSWSASGFVTVAAVGGTPHMYVPLRRPVLSVDCWGVTPNSGKPPWRLAHQLASEIYVAILNHPVVPRPLTMPSGYMGARVMTAIPRSEPVRVPGDVASYAHFSMDVEMQWTVTS